MSLNLTASRALALAYLKRLKAVPNKITRTIIVIINSTKVKLFLWLENILNVSGPAGT